MRSVHYPDVVVRGRGWDRLEPDLAPGWKRCKEQERHQGEQKFHPRKVRKKARRALQLVDPPFDLLLGMAGLLLQAAI
jgi:hypothetical protein